MWIEVTTWDGNNIKGLLKNEPFNISRLAWAAKSLRSTSKDIFDYLRRHPDGRQEGNETSEIIVKMQQAKSKQ